MSYFHQAGIILGQSVLARNSSYSSKLFPPGGTLALETFGHFGNMIHLFVLGVRLDASLLKRIGRKPMIIALSGNALPVALGFLTFLITTPTTNMSRQLIFGLHFTLMRNSVTHFICTTGVLADLDILNSEIGRLASFTSLISDASSWFVVELLPKFMFSLSLSTVAPLMPILVLLAYYGFIFCILRPLAVWMVRCTPEGKPMKGQHFFAILIMVLVVGFSGDYIGQHCGFTAFVFGMSLPSGPPLSSTLVEKLSTVASGLLLPIFCASSGMRTDVSALETGTWVLTEMPIFMGYLGKFAGTILSMLYLDFPLWDALSLALIMCCKGIVEIAMYMALLDCKLVTNQTFALLVISMVTITGICTLVVSYLYDPSHKYITQKGGTSLPYRKMMDLRLLVCIHSEENVPPIINFLEASNPTRTSPISILVLQLKDLEGRATATLTPVGHKNKCSSQLTRSERIAKAFNNLEQTSRGCIMLQHFVGVAPYASMHDDICTLAVDKRTSIVIIPYHKHWGIDGTVETVFPSIKIVNENVINKAPCSVGILIDRSQKGGNQPVFAAGSSLYRIVMIFLGGADDREALEYSQRMAGHPNVYLTVVWVKSQVLNNEKEMYLDSEMMHNLRADTISKERIVYEEEIVTDGVGTTRVVRSMETTCDLFIVGRRHDPLCHATQGLTEWNECPELGTVGDMLTSSEFQFSVLVIQH
ncbi:cation/H(+) antiporter 14-like isoform X2 [Malania oleifera]|uniref:cation/H(+) antiporter 14-like isoform X2 n=1 Tax=Malania oleifera TaxID=397392 RepID=UPI0025ADE95F|nr:cation/H(+) antiporter 14-like isoform X2 [Malania oleifera]